MKICPENITSLKDNEIFVYGANEAGRHGAGAAKTALKWGAIYGRYGFAGKTYGIPTKDCDIQILPLEDIEIHVDHFVEFALSRPDLIFLVTPIGTGRARYMAHDIAPLFKTASKLPNVSLPQSFWTILNEPT